MKLFFSLFLLNLITLLNLQAQQIELSGQIIANGQVEGIHVINKTAYRYATTDQNGFFIIEAKPSDSLYFSSIQYIPKTIVLSAQNISTKSITVTLSESINALDEVLIGTLLTGDLNSDIGNSDAKRPIDFYDLGIPGYTGPRMNLTERRLYDADHGVLYTGLGLNVNKLLNRITGRTKMLKEHVKLDKDKQTIRRIKEIIAPLFFINHELEKEKRMEFYFFCADAPDFQERCRGKSDVEILEFLDAQLEAFKTANLSEN
ncbi:carboxypeptidase-like regulatory domain-containing protein [Flavobacteriaceae bacterium]|nr:carboxypeptidase-like regulatory domain-containing protein [Flavobacteriaceae bacterium]